MLIQTLLKMTTSIETLILSNHSTSGLLSKYYELYKSINYWIREVISPSQKIIFKLKYVIYDYNISLLDTLLNKTKRFTKYSHDVQWKGWPKKIFGSLFPFGSLYQWSLVTGPHENSWWLRLFSRWDYELQHIWWSDYVITNKFSNSASQFLLVATYPVSASGSLRLRLHYLLFSRWLKCL